MMLNSQLNIVFGAQLLAPDDVGVRKKVVTGYRLSRHLRTRARKKTMFLPIGDEPNPHTPAPVTWGLIAVNVVVFLATFLRMSTVAADPADPLLTEYVNLLSQMMPNASPQQIAQQVSAYDLVVYQYGFRPGSPSIVALFTSMFLHGGWMHLIGNMLYLFIYGNNVEHRLGPMWFLFWYIVTGIAAVLLHAAFSPGSQIPMVGASGAISGVLGFYLLWFPRNNVKVLVFLIPIVRVFMVPALWVLIAYLIVDNILPMIISVMSRGAGGGGVAHGAHIGGFVAGVAAAWLLKSRTADYEQRR